MSKTYTIRCKDINDNYNGVFTFNNSKLEAPGLLPGEKAEVSLLYGKDKGKAKVITILEASEERAEPVCPIFGSCGGCTLMHTNYENQLRLKTQVCRGHLEKYGEVGDCIGSDKEYNYRNKIIATLSTDKKGKVVSGLYEETTHKVIPIKSCIIEDEHAREVMNTIVKFMNDFHVKPYNEDNGRGILRHVLFRTAANGDTLVVLVSGSKVFPEKNKLAKAIKESHEFVKGIVLNINTKRTTFVLGAKDEVLMGSEYVTDMMCGLEFRISGKSFYQINTPQAEKIYTDAILKANIDKDDTVLDAYCGIGTIALVAAKLSGAKEVLGVELNEAAVLDAKINAQKSGLKNVRFLQDDAGDYLMAAIGADIHYTTIIMDPPRSGASDEFINAVLKMKPEKIVYISCNPVTLARDLSKLVRKKLYKAEYIQPYDMFPQTGHVETVAVLVRS